MQLECNATKEERWSGEAERRVVRKNRAIVGVREVEERGERRSFEHPLQLETCGLVFY